MIAPKVVNHPYYFLASYVRDVIEQYTRRNEMPDHEKHLALIKLLSWRDYSNKLSINSPKNINLNKHRQTEILMTLDTMIQSIVGVYGGIGGIKVSREVLVNALRICDELDGVEEYEESAGSY